MLTGTLFFSFSFFFFFLFFLFYVIVFSYINFFFFFFFLRDTGHTFKGLLMAKILLSEGVKFLFCFLCENLNILFEGTNIISVRVKFFSTLFCRIKNS